MTRRPGERHRARLQRARGLAHRPEHGLDLAVTLARRDDGSADQHTLRVLTEENALLARELGRVQARCTRWRDDCIVQAERLEALLMRERADGIAKQTRIAALEDTLRDFEARAPSWRSQDELLRQLGALRARNEALSAELRTRRATPPPADAELGARQVLCVGGRARQMPVYRELVERGGGRFDHVDAADPSCLPRLRLALADADVVILQPGYVCQGACRVVDEHCQRAGVRCVQLDKACAIGFARTLADAIVSTPRPRGRASPSG